MDASTHFLPHGHVNEELLLRAETFGLPPLV
jgi:hypothetical protein